MFSITWVFSFCQCLGTSFCQRRMFFIIMNAKFVCFYAVFSVSLLFIWSGSRVNELWIVCLAHSLDVQEIAHLCFSILLMCFKNDWDDQQTSAVRKESYFQLAEFERNVFLSKHEKDVIFYKWSLCVLLSTRSNKIEQKKIATDFLRLLCRSVQCWNGT